MIEHTIGLGPITSVDVLPVRLPAVRSLHISGGQVTQAGATADRILVRVTADGVCGWGEATPTPLWTYETTESITSTLTHHLAPAVIGIPAWDIDAALAACERVIHPGLTIGAPLAKSAIDMALHDLIGHALGISVGQLWGQRRRSHIALGWVVSGADADEIAASVAEGAANGYSAFKIKIGTGKHIDDDIAAVRSVRDAAPHAQLWVDANSGYRLDSAVTVARKLEPLDLAAFEQPLPANDFYGHRELRRRCGVPIALDESLREPRDLLTAIRLESIDIAVAKVQRTGGLARSRRLCQLAEDSGLRIMGSGLTDSDLGLAASLQLFAAFDVDAAVDLNGRQFITSAYVGERTVVACDGVAEAPTGPGLGVDVDPALVNALTFDPFDSNRSSDRPFIKC